MPPTIFTWARVCISLHLVRDGRPGEVAWADRYGRWEGPRPGPLSKNKAETSSDTSLHTCGSGKAWTGYPREASSYILAQTRSRSNRLAPGAPEHRTHCFPAHRPRRSRRHLRTLKAGPHIPFHHLIMQTPFFIIIQLSRQMSPVNSPSATHACSTR